MSPAAEHGFRRVAIIGLGLMGGSLALALRRLPAPPRIAASTAHAADLDRALALGIVDDAANDPAAVLPEADLVVYATPVGATLELLGAHRELYAGDAVLTDLGSVKRPVVSRARALGLAGRFVGGHPMTGSHRSGLAAARAGLYDGARVWLTPAAGSGAGGAPGRSAAASAALDRVAALWRGLGAHPAVTGAEEHDWLMAWASHLPQLGASGLAGALARAGIARTDLGPGGADATRIAAGSPALWADILLHNADLLRRPLEELRGVLAELADALERGDREMLQGLLARASAWRAED
ncbi:MAG TPA: prephenate dehydrogenase/arogenate dehydrogenase family protein [Longimicrobiales bacterium]